MLLFNILIAKLLYFGFFAKKTISLKVWLKYLQIYVSFLTELSTVFHLLHLSIATFSFYFTKSRTSSFLLHHHLNNKFICCLLNGFKLYPFPSLELPLKTLRDNVELSVVGNAMVFLQFVGHTMRWVAKMNSVCPPCKIMCKRLWKRGFDI